MKTPHSETIVLDKIVGGGQALGALADGRKVFVWGGLPDETVAIRVTKKKRYFVEAVVENVVLASPERITPRDTISYLSTSPWQIMTPEAEHHYKAALVEEAFELHDIVLPNPINVSTDGQMFHYRNKVEFSWFGDVLADGSETLDLAFFRRGSKGKIPIDTMSLARPEIMKTALAVRDLLRQKAITARDLKTLLIRCDQEGHTVWQLYTKSDIADLIDANDAASLCAQGGEVIYSDPRSPASRITTRLAAFGDIVLTDTILNVPFRYATEGFFQVNLPIYEQTLRDMKQWITPASSVVDLYSGVGSIGLTIGGERCVLIESDANAVREMRKNITRLTSSATAILAPAEKALSYITPNHTIIVDPPRAGLHSSVVAQLLAKLPPRIIYLSCNPVTQARDIALLAQKYGIRHHQAYNFFPRTPHIEHLVVLDRYDTQQQAHNQFVTTPH